MSHEDRNRLPREICFRSIDVRCHSFIFHHHCTRPSGVATPDISVDVGVSSADIPAGHPEDITVTTTSNETVSSSTILMDCASLISSTIRDHHDIHSHNRGNCLSSY